MKLRQKHDLIGRRFGRLQVIAFVCSAPNTTIWRVLCNCGTDKNVRRSNLLNSQSCGCLALERLSQRVSTHGLTKPGQHHPLYRVWDGMKKRCHGKNPHHRYGGRGISVCERWRFGDDKKTGFECFLDDMGDKPSSDHSIDRIDYNGPYAPHNCRWATQIEQQRNRSTNRMVLFQGRGMTLTEAIGLTGLAEGTVWGRLHLGWSITDALSVPVGGER